MFWLCKTSNFTAEHSSASIFHPVDSWHASSLGSGNCDCAFNLGISHDFPLSWSTPHSICSSAQSSPCVLVESHSQPLLCFFRLYSPLLEPFTPLTLRPCNCICHILPELLYNNCLGFPHTQPATCTPLKGRSASYEYQIHHFQRTRCYRHPPTPALNPLSSNSTGAISQIYSDESTAVFPQRPTCPCTAISHGNVLRHVWQAV